MSTFNLSSLAVRERDLTLFFLLLSIVVGVYAFIALGRSEDPSFSARTVTVTVRWPGATPEQVRDQVVDRLEKRIYEVDYLDKVKSTIHSGQATLQVEFEDHTPLSSLPDLYYEVRKRMLDEAMHLPPGVIGPTVNDDFSDVYFNLIALRAEKLPVSALIPEAERLRDQLQKVEGVKKALILSERSERLFVEFDNARLVNLGLQPREIFAAIDASNRLLPQGRIETQGPRLHLSLDADLSNMAELAELPIRAGGRVLKLSDIATIRKGYEDPPGYLARSQGQDAIVLGVVMQDGVNGIRLGERLRDAIEAERRELPLGVTLDLLTNQADAIHHAINLFQIKFLIAVLVLVLVSVLAIGVRAGLIVGITVPVILGITFFIMLLMGIHFDRITLGALILALGLLVDDAIISVEAMLVKVEEGWDRVRAAAHSWSITASPMLFGTLVTVAGFLPVGLAQSVVGEYGGNMFWVLAISLLVSWFVAVIFVPYLGVRILRDVPQGTRKQHEGVYQSDFYLWLRHVVAWCVVRRKTVVAATFALLLMSVWLLNTFVTKEFFPVSERPELQVDVYMPPGSSIAATDATVRKIENIVLGNPDIKSLSAYVGGGAPRFFISLNPEAPDPAFGKVVIVAKDTAARERIRSLVEGHIEGGDFAEARVRVHGLLMGPPLVWPVQYRVIGPDANTLRRIANEVRVVMKQNPNVVDPHLDWETRVPVLHLRTDPDRLRLMGLTPQDVAEQLQFQLEGVPVTQLRVGLRTVDLVVRGAADGKKIDANALEGMELMTGEGRKVPFDQLGAVEVRYEEPILKRYDREPYISVQTEIRDAQPRDVNEVVWKSLEPLRASLPPGYRLDIGGSEENSSKASHSVEKLQPLMVAVMLMFVMMQMRSFSGTLMVVATAPLGLIGAVLTLLLFNQPFGFVAMQGLVGLAGIVMRNTLILTQQVKDNFESGMATADAVVEAAVQRARPVMLTALAAVLAFVPLTLDRFWGPMAFVLIGGLLVGTIITLLFVPALYALWFRIDAKQLQG